MYQYRPGIARDPKQLPCGTLQSNGWGDDRDVFTLPRWLYNSLVLDMTLASSAQYHTYHTVYGVRLIRILWSTMSKAALRSIAFKAVTSCLSIPPRISLTSHRLLDSLVVECWLRVQEVRGSIPSQGPRHIKDVIKMVQVVPLFSTQHWKGKYWLFLKN